MNYNYHFQRIKLCKQLRHIWMNLPWNSVNINSIFKFSGRRKNKFKWKEFILYQFITLCSLSIVIPRKKFVLVQIWGQNRAEREHPRVEVVEQCAVEEQTKGDERVFAEREQTVHTGFAIFIVTIVQIESEQHWNHSTRSAQNL